MLDELYRREKEKGNGIYVISTNPKFKYILCLHWTWGGFHVMYRAIQDRARNTIQKKASWMSGYVYRISVNDYSVRVVSRVNYFQKISGR